jgi:methanogenic corrinoid protein MtbC1
VKALLTHDETAVYARCDDDAQRCQSRVTVFADLLQVAVKEIAERWYRGSVGGAEETSAAILVASAAERLAPTPAVKSVPAGSRCLLILQPGERHVLGLRMLSLALEDEGWMADIVSGPDWRRCLELLERRPLPRFVGISVGNLHSRLGLTKAIQVIGAFGLPVLVGGSAFNRSPDLWWRVGASAYGPDARVGVVLARRFAVRRRA